jgi:hypothetical protein
MIDDVVNPDLESEQFLRVELQQGRGESSKIDTPTVKK